MNETGPRPIPDSYWVLSGRLLAGEYPGRVDEHTTRKRIDALLEAGVDLFIDLTQPHELVPYAELLGDEAKIYEVDARHVRFPIGDFGLPTVEQMNSILNAIDAGLQAGHKIYLHCWGGIGRTGTTVGCYLVRQGNTGAEALSQLAGWWRRVPKSIFHPYSPETKDQMDFVLRWAEHDEKFRGTK
jgi:protein-tyrosine phosphatase